MNWFADITLGQLTIGVAALLAAVGVWWKILLPIWRWALQMEALAELIHGASEQRDKSGALIEDAVPSIHVQLAKIPEIAEQVAEVAEQIEEIHHETHTNNGGSIKDAVVRIEVEQGRQGLVQAQLLAKTDDLAQADQIRAERASDAHRVIHERIDHIIRPRRPWWRRP